jgi:hypothetical protein
VVKFREADPKLFPPDSAGAQGYSGLPYSALFWADSNTLVLSSSNYNEPHFYRWNVAGLERPTAIADWEPGKIVMFGNIYGHSVALDVPKGDAGSARLLDLVTMTFLPAFNDDRPALDTRLVGERIVRIVADKSGSLLQVRTPSGPKTVFRSKSVLEFDSGPPLDDTYNATLSSTFDPGERFVVVGVRRTSNEYRKGNVLGWVVDLVTGKSTVFPEDSGYGPFALGRARWIHGVLIIPDTTSSQFQVSSADVIFPSKKKTLR